MCDRPPRDEAREWLREAAEGGHVAAISSLFEEHFAEDEIDTVADILGKLPGVADGDAPCTPT